MPRPIRRRSEDVTDAPLTIAISSPERPTIELEADELVLPGSAGEFTVLPGHTPLLTTLTQGVLIARRGEREAQFFAVHEGFAEILRNRVAVLADVMESAEEIDIKRAKAAEERARAKLKERDENIEFAVLEAALARSLARQQAHARTE